MDTSPGKALGGGSSNTNAADGNSGPLSPEDLRRRRLAALERMSPAPKATTTTIPNKTTQKSPASNQETPRKSVTIQSSSSSAAAASSTIPASNTTPTRAAATSFMETTNSTPKTPVDAPPSAISPQPMDIATTTEADDDEDDEDLQRALALSLAGDTTDEEEDEEENHETTIKRIEDSTSPTTPLTNPMKATTSSTTLLDYYSKSSAPCNSLDFHYIMWDPDITTDNDKRRWLSQGISFKQVDAHALAAAQQNHTYTQTSSTADSLLAAIILHYESWGLTQAHGGPCGVLASIQAEMLRLLLFGPRTTANNNHSDQKGADVSLEYPTQVTNTFVTAAPDLYPPVLRRALAMAMAIIWARASMAAATTSDGETTQAVSPSSMDSSHHASNPSVQIVLPKLSVATAELEWNHLEPWSSDSGGSGQSEFLVTYTISLNDNDGDNSNNATNSSQEEQPNTKRLRKSACVHTLAEKAANFLLETKALEWFERPGGVILMVLSLAMSRGIPNVQGDMDDPTAKLTSNFGHCSQELINLLLTGQAVSNVFDNTMRPSGELICRGIQARPEIGYLSQLESMRYLEVGGYYKTPNFPIWVIGSTSHFTVMFGDAACLQESASDILLEKVRRAFKSIDENENGFIQTQQLAEFLKAVELVPQKISEHAIPTLAATMEAYGAGIILWEDLWKRTSRLLTGASLEAVLEWNGESDFGSSSTSTAIVPAPAPPPPVPDPMEGITDDMSDEELARRLQAAWNNGGDMTMTPAPAPAPTPNPQSHHQRETYGKTFQLYHYNGLRGGKLKPFRVTRLSADEAIGASVSLGSASQSTQHHQLIAGAGGDLEDVLRSKWPSCKIDWLGTGPPSID